MRKTLLALTASAAIAGSGLVAPTPAQAHAWWIAPAIIGGVLVTGAVIANSRAYAYGPYGPYYGPAYYSGGMVSVAPSCRIVRERTMDGWRRVRVCR